MTARRPLSFVDGIGVGVGGLVLLPLLYFVVARGDFGQLYSQLGPGATLPVLTRIVLSPAWAYGVPSLLVVGFGLALWRRPNRWAVFALAGAALVASVITYVGTYQPIWQLAGNIQ